MERLSIAGLSAKSALVLGDRLGIECEAVTEAYAHIFSADEYPFPVHHVHDEWATLLMSASVGTVLAEAGGSAVGHCDLVLEWACASSASGQT